MFTAIITRNFRDVNTSSPKVLLLQVQNDSAIFRDHCWVTISDTIKDFVPKKNHIKTKICFDAKVKEYQTYGPVKQTLISIKNIRRLNK
jgi:hypothetical protein